MVLDLEILATELRTNTLQAKTANECMMASTKNIEKLLTELLHASKATTERYLVNGYTVPAGTNYEVVPVSSPEYERARIFCSVAFTEDTIAGLAIDLYFAGHRIGEILKIQSGEAGASAGSEAIDINKLSGFNLVLRNLDVDQDVVITSLKIVLYNE